MKMRPIGNSGLEAGPLAFGGNVFGWTADEATSFRLLDAFVDAGLNLIDTADVYSRWAPGNQGGESETIIGRWLERTGKRNRVLIATKVGMEVGPGKSGLSAARMQAAVEESLRRLKIDHIDLYQAHKDDPSTPLEETLGAFGALIRQGKVRAIGASNYSGARLTEALRISKENQLPAYQCLQPHYNLAERSEFERDLEPVCRASGLGVIPYYSLASGFLTGKYRSEDDAAGKARSAGVKKYLNDRGFRILSALDEVSARFSSTPARVAIAWLLTRSVVTAPIASATTIEQFHELIAGTQLELDQDAIDCLDTASA